MIGHNTIAADQLKSIIARVEKLEAEKADIAADIRDVFAEAKGNGFDVKTIKAIIKRRAKDAQQVEQEESMMDVYLHALGMLADTPLGKAAIEKQFNEGVE